MKPRFVAMVLMACLASPIFGQNGARSVSGTVRDQGGAVVVGAEVVVSGSGFLKSALTDQDGRFLFKEVPETALTLRVDAPSFHESAAALAGP